MARSLLDNKCRFCRREGVKLFLKGQRCFSPKCPLERKGAVLPGIHGGKKKRSRVSDYGRQLREKQKLKRLYSLKERQFKRYFEKAKKVKGATGEVLLQILDSRLDNIVFRLGFTSSRFQARQIISHSHILVNGKKVDIPSYQVKQGETISLSPAGLKIPTVAENLAKKETLPSWLERKAAVGRMKRLPHREEIETDVDEQAVVEYYSR